MVMASTAEIARMAARILARRLTRQDEIPQIISSIGGALQALEQPDLAATVAAEEPEAAASAPAARPRRPRLASSAPETEAPAPPPAPKLLRRSEVVPASAEAPVPFAVPLGAVRGVVKWFDPRARRAILRLPGVGGDVPVEAGFLDEMGITRLYKGQEVEATLEAGQPPRVARLAVPGGAWSVSATGGVVRSRRAKPVVVELKREALKRVAARAEAELLLRPSRVR